MGMYNLSKDEAKAAAELIKDKLLADSYFMTAGRRNDDTVDLLICCHVLGIDGIKEAMKNKNLQNDSYNLSKFKEKKDLVDNYLDTWGPKGNEHLAMRFLVDGYYDIDKLVRPGRCE